MQRQNVIHDKMPLCGMPFLVCRNFNRKLLRITKCCWPIEQPNIRPLPICINPQNKKNNKQNSSKWKSDPKVWISINKTCITTHAILSCSQKKNVPSLLCVSCYNIYPDHIWSHLNGMKMNGIMAIIVGIFCIA